MKVTCSTLWRNKTTLKYCKSHPKPICGYCKSLLNGQRDEEIAIISQEFNDMIDYSQELIYNVESDFDYYRLEEYFPKFKKILELYKKDFEIIRCDTIKALEKGRVKKFRKCETQLEKFLDDFREEEVIMGVMSFLYESILFDMKNSVTSSDTTESEYISNKETKASEDNLDKSIEPTIFAEESKKAVDIVGIQSPDDLRSKYFPKGNLKEYLSELSLNLSNKDDVDFMKEFIKKKQPIDVEKYTFELPENYGDELIIREFIDTCVNPKVCKEIEFINTLKLDFLCFSPYESCISKIMEAGDFRLYLHNFVLDKDTLDKFATKVESKNILIDLDDCWLKHCNCKKPEKITWHNEKQWNLNYVKYEKCEGDPAFIS
ncbi:unnamed protein product [Moneuplotes crassus]|uniref:Uncharacterized protein n=1 Tax=Euplotes crassus TaxID=5936 RepID=A0AAD1Y2V2_EUPCR|nr:unnamed protein product [Moneuplotes crassus]